MPYGYLCCCHVFPTAHSASMNIGKYIYFQTIVVSGYMPRIWIAESYDRQDMEETRMSIDKEINKAVEHNGMLKWHVEQNATKMK